jgi:hypothetical protein
VAGCTLLNCVRRTFPRSGIGYSALVRQDLHKLARRYGVEIAHELFLQLLQRRADEQDIRVSRALEKNFSQPRNGTERRTRIVSKQCRAARKAAWEQDLFKQKKRLADAHPIFAVKETKKARDDVRIASNKIERT